MYGSHDRFEKLLKVVLHGRGVSSRECRVNEVCRCESTIQSSCINLQMSVPPFLTHTFEELCWQAREERKPVMVLLLCPSACLHHGKLNEATLRVFQKVLEQCKEGWLFWTAETTSKDGQKALKLYGNQANDVDQLIFLTPSAGRNLTFIERIEASDIEDDDWLSRSTTSICERATFLIESLVIEREKLARWRAEKQEQDGQFAECEINNQSLDMPPGNINDPEREKEKEEEQTFEVPVFQTQEHGQEKPGENVQDEKIREERRKRTSKEPKEGITIALRFRDLKVQRKIKVNAFFQEVYDWAGGLEDMPHHFTLQRQSQVVFHRDTVSGRELLDVNERTEAECKRILNHEVSFRGNLPQNETEILESTVEDENVKREGKKKRKSTEEEKDANRKLKIKRKKKHQEKKIRMKRKERKTKKREEGKQDVADLEQHNSEHVEDKEWEEKDEKSEGNEKEDNKEIKNDEEQKDKVDEKEDVEQEEDKRKKEEEERDAEKEDINRKRKREKRSGAQRKKNKKNKDNN
ncbi:hypothetical protein ACROYT_G014971 [Oculina patagonica]